MVMCGGLYWAAHRLAHLWYLREKPKEVAKVARQMESIGTDMIGMMTGMSYEGVEAGKIHPLLKERLCAMVESVKIPI